MYDKLELNYFYKERFEKNEFIILFDYYSEKFNDIKLGYIELNIEDKDKRKRYYLSELKEYNKQMMDKI